MPRIPMPEPSPPLTSPAPHVHLPEDLAVGRARSAATERAYAEDFARFGLWCTAMGARALPADPMVVMFYLGHLAPTWRPATATDPPDAVTARGEVCESPGLAPGTLMRHLAAIAAHHADAGHPNPTRHPLVIDMHQRIRDRAADAAPRRRVAPAVPPRIRTLVADVTAGAGAEKDPVAARDTALILLGYAAALRPRELAALTLDQVREDPAGAWIDVLRSPDELGGTDPWATSTHITAVGDDACPVAAWRCWRSWLPDDDVPAPAEGTPDGELTGIPAFRPIRKGRLDPDGLDSPTARQRIGAAALTERSLARIVGARAQHAGLLGHWTAGSLSRRDSVT